MKFRHSGFASSGSVTERYVRRISSYFLSREGEKEFEFDLGMVTPVKYEQLILFLHAVVDVKPDLEFFNEVED